MSSDITQGHNDAAIVLYTAYLLALPAMFVIGCVVVAVLEWWERRSVKR